MPEQRTDLFQNLWDFLSQILFPNWPDLIGLIPGVLLALIAGFALYLAWIWRRAAERNRPRLPRRLATGSPPPGVHMPGPSRWPFVAPIGLAMLFFGLIFVSRGELGAIAVALLVGGLAISVIAALGWMREAMREWQTTEFGHESEAWAQAHGTPHALTGGRAGTLALGRGTAGAMALTPEPAFVEPPEPPPGVHMPGPSPWPFFAPIGIALIFFGLILSMWLVLGGLVLSVIAAAGWLREASREWKSTERVGHAVPKTRDPVRAWPRRVVPIFAGVIALSVLLAALPAALAMILPAEPDGPTETPLVVPAQPEIFAYNAESFDRSILVVPAGRDFELVFHNEDAGIPHDVVITESAARETVFFDGEIITGVATTTYQVPAIEEGDYYFFCSVHPPMNGTVLARPETNGPAQPNGAPPGPGTPQAP